MEINKKYNILILRGLARQKQHWGDFLPKLEDSPLTDTVLCLDLPGFGDQSHEPSPHTIYDIQQHVRGRFLKQPPANDLPWIALGVSLGGMVLMEWAKNYPKDFEKTFIVNSSSADMALPWSRFNPFFLTDFVKALPKNLNQAERVILERISNEHNNDEELIHKWGEIAEETPMNPIHVASQIKAAALYKAPKSIFSDLIFLSSTADRLVNPKSSEKLSERFNAPHFVHNSAGHELTLDDPDWVLDKLEKSL